MRERKVAFPATSSSRRVISAKPDNELSGPLEKGTVARSGTAPYYQKNSVKWVSRNSVKIQLPPPPEHAYCC
jgi:hypothetical protein